MAEPSLTTTLGMGTNVGVVALATIALGPILGEYAVIVAAGLLGTLIGLSENIQPSVGKSFLFLFRGVTFSCVFTGLITSLVVKFSPVDLGLTPYLVMGAISFCIGWMSDRVSLVKDLIVKKIMGKASSIGGKDE